MWSSLVALSCGGGGAGTGPLPTPPAAVASVGVSPPSATVQAGATLPLVATVMDAAGAPLAGRTVTWSSSGVATATVSGSGVVTGIAPGGPVTISAVSEGRTGTTQITVTPVIVVAVASVSVAPPIASVEISATLPLVATVRDAAGATLAGRVVTWTSSDAAIATVSGGGVVSGVTPGGPVTVSAVSEGHTGTAQVTVTPVVAVLVEVIPATSNVVPGGTSQLIGTPRDSHGAVLSGALVTWTSSNAAIASVSASGLVTGVAAGSVTVTATSGSAGGTGLVAVSLPVAGEFRTLTNYAVSVSAPLTITGSDRSIQVLVRIPLGAPQPLPVVVLSPGNATNATGHLEMVAWGDLLASAGYAVVHMSHPAIADGFYCTEFGVPAGDCQAVDFTLEVAVGGSLPAINIARARDASAVLNQISVIATAVGVALDSTRVGFAGWSAGAHTALLLAGTKVDLSPTVMNVSFKDRRFRAFMGTSPQGIGRLGLTATSWDGVAGPVMTQTGAADFALVTPASRRNPFTFMPVGDKYEAWFDSPAANHNTFALDEFGNAALEVFVGRSGLAFFDAHLRDITAARTWLTTNQLSVWSAGIGLMSAK